MLTLARAEINSSFGQIPTTRQPALRRALSDDWLLACDLPRCADAPAVEAWIALVRGLGWTVSEDGKGWLLLDRLDRLPVAYALPEPPAGELGAVISLLSRHIAAAQPDPRVIRRLAKSAEESREALERACGSLHQALAGSLRRGEALPACLPWLCAIAKIKEENP